MTITERAHLEMDRIKASFKAGMVLAKYKEYEKYPSLLVLPSRQLEVKELLEEYIGLLSDLEWIAIRMNRFDELTRLCEDEKKAQLYLWNLKQELNVA